MGLQKQMGAILEQIKAKRPLIHQLTNYVSANDCANITLAMGASPVMADDRDEVEDMVAGAAALVLNLGTLNARKAEAMLIAGKKAGILGIPVILDPVGVGATKLRAATANRLLREVPLSVIRGNLAEIKFLAGLSQRSIGVDSTAGDQAGTEVARELSHKLGCIVAVTGKIDVVAQGNRALSIANGHPNLALVTGTGCMATAIVGCCCAVANDLLLATATGIIVMGIAGELAQQSLQSQEGLGTFRMRLFDAVSKITADELVKYGRVY